MTCLASLQNHVTTAYMLFLKNWTAQHARHGPLVTHHDLLKAVAVIIMIIDHVGFYFAPDQMWYRVIGRMGFPVWFFLAGYSRQGGFSTILLPGIATLMLARELSGAPLFSINALLTIFLIRLMILKVPADLYRRDPMWLLCIPLFALLLAPSSNRVFEYGTIGLLFGYLGFACCNTPPDRQRHLLALLSFIAFVALQLNKFPFTALQASIMATGTAAFLYWVYTLRPGQYAFFEKYPGLGPLLRGLGRHTLLIYVAHLVLFIWLKRGFHLQ